MFKFFVLKEGGSRPQFFYLEKNGERGLQQAYFFILLEEWDEKCVGSWSQFFPPGEGKCSSRLAAFDMFPHLGKYVDKNMLATFFFYLGKNGEKGC